MILADKIINERKRNAWLQAALDCGWSFLTGEWSITWVVWVLAGVLFAPISALIAYIKK